MTISPLSRLDPPSISGKKFTQRLLKWDRDHNKRDMPWKGEKDPYRIWLSEIILQQTRVDQGHKYYKAFIKNYPDIHKLARASEEKVFKLWEGLGYYTRCRNLIHTARFISKERNGIFPDDYDAIRNLKGIGPYTAAAIASFAFQRPYAVVDGNVSRVLSRVFGISETVHSASGKKIFNALASELLHKEDPARYNQAIMDFGATVCKPASPLCDQCVFRNECVAFATNRISDLPYKERKRGLKQRWFYYLVLCTRDKIGMKQRTDRDIWQNLYEFPLLEFPVPARNEKIFSEASRLLSIPLDPGKLNCTPVVRQQLTHQAINGHFIRIDLDNIPEPINGLSWFHFSESRKLACPKMVRQYLDDLTGKGSGRG